MLTTGEFSAIRMLRWGDRTLDAGRPVVGVKISDGLGNQLFQYAAGLSLAERLGATLLCDTRHHDRRDRGDRRLGLHDFGIDLATARVPPHRPVRRVASALHLMPDAFRGAMRYRCTVAFDPGFHQLSGNVALSGYFQSWRYFEGHEATVRRAFNTSRLVAPQTAAIAAQIRSARNPVAVHVRRGDYITPSAIAYYGMLGADYYFRAKAELEKRVEAPTYFLFTDDPTVAGSELRDWPGLIPVGPHTATEDLYLMSQCRHFIIANSTYSWWGAWLGSAADKQVIAPNAWLGAGNPYQMPTDERLPLDWIKI